MSKYKCIVQCEITYDCDTFNEDEAYEEALKKFHNDIKYIDNIENTGIILMDSHNDIVLFE